MLNKEKYKEELEKILANDIAVSKNGEIYRCTERENCDDCIFCDVDCIGGAKVWLNSEYKEHILDEVEKEYLKAVIRPFRDKVISIRKIESPKNHETICICVHTDDDYYDYAYLPHFKRGTMYQNIKPGKAYTIEELGL